MSVSGGTHFLAFIISRYSEKESLPLTVNNVLSISANAWLKNFAAATVICL